MHGEAQQDWTSSIRSLGREGTLKRGLAGLLVVTLAACVVAPDLDESVVGESATSIRERIVDHGDWGRRLTDEQLDQLAAFIAEYAGAAEGTNAEGAPGWAIWRAEDCGSCHSLAVGGDADDGD